MSTTKKLAREKNTKKGLMLGVQKRTPEQLDRLQKEIGYYFKNPLYLTQALNHPSAHPKNKEFERLEFLGDRVLGICMAKLLLRQFPDENEGKLAKRHAFLVSKDSCLIAAGTLNLEPYINLIVDKEAVSNRPAIVADAMEALCGALFLDAGGIDNCEALIARLWKDLIRSDHDETKDPKSTLQEWLQKNKKAPPRYVLISQEGPAHQPLLVYEIQTDDFPAFQGKGSSRRLAERDAAQKALEFIKGQIKKGK